MCIGSKPAATVVPPEVVKVDPKVEADKADADATAKTNTELAARRNARRGSALSTGAGLAPMTSALSAGKQTLGG